MNTINYIQYIIDKTMLEDGGGHKKISQHSASL